MADKLATYASTGKHKTEVPQRICQLIRGQKELHWCHLLTQKQQDGEAYPSIDSFVDHSRKTLILGLVDCGAEHQVASPPAVAPCIHSVDRQMLPVTGRIGIASINACSLREDQCHHSVARRKTQSKNGVYREQFVREKLFMVGV